MKIIFLDVDGVMAPFFGEKVFDEKCINNLMYIINKTGAKIVISSDWKYKLEDLYNEWHSTILPPYIGHTDRILVNNPGIYNKEFTQLEGIRENEIINFLEVCKKGKDNIEAWISIDDMNLNLKNLILVNPKTGLTRENAEQAIYILNKQNEQ